MTNSSTNNQPESSSNENKTSTDNWLRLSPASVVFFISKQIFHLVKDALPGLAPLAIIIFNSDNKVWLSSLIGIGMLTLLIVGSILQFWFFRYQFKGDKIYVKQGVFNKQETTLRFERVQNINMVEPFYYAPFSLVTLQLESAGSNKNEVNLAGIHKDAATEIKADILKAKARFEQNKLDNPNTENLNEADLINEQSSDLLATANIKQLVKYGLSSNGLFFFLIFLAPFAGMLDNLMENIIGKENILKMVELLGGGIQGGFILVALVIFTVLFCMILFSILGAIFRFYHYQLSLNDHTLKRRSGLLNTHEESVKLPKIQAFIQQTNFIGKWFKIENIVLKQVSTQIGNAKANLFVVPVRTKEQSVKLSKICINCNETFNQLKQVSKKYFYRGVIQSSLFIIALTLFLYFVSSSKLTLLVLILIPFISLIIRKRWLNYGYQLGENFAQFRSGFWGYRKTTFELFKVQKITIRQSYFQKRGGFANIDITLASSRISIPYVPLQDAINWTNKISYKIESTEQNWF